MRTCTQLAVAEFFLSNGSFAIELTFFALVLPRCFRESPGRGTLPFFRVSDRFVPGVAGLVGWPSQYAIPESIRDPRVNTRYALSQFAILEPIRDPNPIPRPVRLVTPGCQGAQATFLQSWERFQRFPPCCKGPWVGQYFAFSAGPIVVLKPSFLISDLPLLPSFVLEVFIL